jgi:hypothetical protein
MDRKTSPKTAHIVPTVKACRAVLVSCHHGLPAVTLIRLPELAAVDKQRRPLTWDPAPARTTRQGRTRAAGQLCPRKDEGMALQLAPEEPEAGPWRAEPLAALVQALTQRGPGKIVSGRPVVVAIDGRSNNGKTWLAARIARAVPGSVVIHTDSIAWEHSRFGWADLLIDGILGPVHQGQAVSYRPPRWVERGREGSLDVPAGCPLLIIEGDGAGRREVAYLIDALIWVQADEREAERRRLARDRDPDALDRTNKAPGGVRSDHAGWMAEEIPFNAAQRTWERADVIVCGSPQIPHDPSTEVVVAPPLRARG